MRLILQDQVDQFDTLDLPPLFGGVVWVKSTCGILLLGMPDASIIVVVQTLKDNKYLFHYVQAGSVKIPQRINMIIHL